MGKLTLSIDDRTIEQAIDSDIRDFEDAIQYFSAVRCRAEFIITRNQKDYSDSEIPVLAPAEYLNLISG